MGDELFFSTKLNRYRVILLLGVVAYLGFGVFYRLRGIEDTLSMSFRIVIATALLIVVALSYLDRFLENKSMIISYIIIYFLNSHLLYLIYANNFNNNYFIALILSIFALNTILENNKALLYFNYFINLTILILLVVSPLDLLTKLFLFSTLVFVSALSYFLGSRQKKLEDKFKKAARKYKRLLDNMPVAVAKHKVILEAGKAVDYRFLEVNNTFEKLTGLKSEAIIGKRISDILQEINEIKLDWVEKYGEVALGGDSLEFEEYFKPLDKWYRISVYSEQKGYFTTAFVDITKRKKKEEEQNILLTSINDIIFELDDSYRIKKVLTNNEDALFIPEEKMIGNKVTEILDQKSNTEFKEILKEVQETKQRGSLEYESALPGEDKWFKADIIATTDIYNKDKYLAVISEITQRKKAEIKLKQEKKRAEKANRAKSEFLANMSHEIRTPLNAVIGFSEILEGQLNDDVNQGYLNSIKTASYSLLDLINNILDMSKIESGMLKIELHYLNLNDLLEEMRVIFSEKAENKNLEFILAADIPQLEIKLNEARLRQILINLIANAIKFTKKGYVKIIVNTSICDESRLDLELIIEDTGIGITKEAQDKIFAPFTQQDGQSTREYGGTGLGLAITKKLSKLLNGEIDLESEVGQGSKFILKFEQIEFKESNAVSKDNFKSEIVFETAKVLVVDDVKSNRDFLRVKLENRGLEIIEARNGKEGVELARKEDLDLVIMDLKMPVMDGYQALKKIRKENDEIIILAFTASATKEEKARAKAASFDEFLTKPIKEEELLEKLAKYLAYQKKKRARDKSKTDLLKLDFRQEIIDELLEKFSVQVGNIEGAIVIDQIEEFIFELKNFAKENNLQALNEYSNNLEKHLNNFELDEIEASLLEFEELIDN